MLWDRLGSCQEIMQDRRKYIVMCIADRLFTARFHH